MEISVKIVAPMRLAAFRHVGPYHLIGSQFGRLHEWAVNNDVPMTTMMGLYYDDPMETPPDQLKSDAAMEIADGLQPNGEGAPRIIEFAGGTHAVYTHMGSYEGLGEAWGRFMGMVPDAGHQFSSGPFFEIYVNDCSKVPECDVRTDLYAPIKPPGSAIL